MKASRGILFPFGGYLILVIFTDTIHVKEGVAWFGFQAVKGGGHE